MGPFPRTPSGPLHPGRGRGPGRPNRGKGCTQTFRSVAGRHGERNVPRTFEGPKGRRHGFGGVVEVVVNQS